MSLTPTHLSPWQETRALLSASSLICSGLGDKEGASLSHSLCPPRPAAQRTRRRAEKGDTFQGHACPACFLNTDRAPCNQGLNREKSVGEALGPGAGDWATLHKQAGAEEWGQAGGSEDAPSEEEWGGRGACA